MLDGTRKIQSNLPGAGWAIPAGRNCLLTICLRQIGNESHLSHPQVLSLSPNHPFHSKSVFLLFLDKSRQISYTDGGKPIWVKDAVTLCVQGLSGTRWAFFCFPTSSRITQHIFQEPVEICFFLCYSVSGGVGHPCLDAALRTFG